MQEHGQGLETRPRPLTHIVLFKRHNVEKNEQYVEMRSCRFIIHCEHLLPPWSISIAWRAPTKSCIRE